MAAKAAANAFFVDEDYESAIQKYSEALKDAPNDADTLSKRSAAYLKLNKLQCAVADARDALKLDTSLLMAYYRQGVALFGLEKYNEAKASFSKGKEMAGNHDHALARFKTWIRKCDAEMENDDDGHDDGMDDNDQ
jgi:tetratricopeptide (TPR) repeat protein